VTVSIHKYSIRPVVYRTELVVVMLDFCVLFHVTPGKSSIILKGLSKPRLQIVGFRSFASRVAFADVNHDSSCLIPFQSSFVCFAHLFLINKIQNATSVINISTSFYRILLSPPAITTVWTSGW
jgi:hypothetical protein